ncbi:hypothetical protein F5876DRAFT_67027 [Lentinula aff. lateritia]|uniref:Uncharacterized protein n=1 Tax=Lentinula aff. lateritia TaxID=2804960 RepID=A0ACC1TVK3_9AGAR|nr:hypothetical protein F5876DRAFT_67027 [Lentinula aff. lateritia]
MTILGNTMYIVSFVALAAILSTKMLNKRIKRTITWNFFIASWMLHCVTFFLSIGHQIGSPAPPFGLCLVQAGLRLALDALRHTSLLHSIIVATVRGMNHSSSKRMRVLVWIFLTSPLVVYVAVFLMTFIMVAQDKSQLQRDQTFYFCNVKDEVGIWTSSIIVFLCALAFIIYEIIRIGVFTVFPIIALFLSVILSFSAAGSWTPSSGMRINVVDASLPLACALIFGSQEVLIDLLNVWMFWRESSPYRSTQHSQTHSSGLEHFRTGGRSRILLDPVVPRVGVKVSTSRIQDRDDEWASKLPVESDIELHKDAKVESL